MSLPSFDIIVAHDTHRGIGKNNTLPWHLPEDMAHFKRITSTSISDVPNTVIMGRKTYDSLPDAFKPLPKRRNIVVSASNRTYSGAETASSITDALTRCCSNSAIFCIGGSRIYDAMITHPLCRYLYITHIDTQVDCDTFFPAYESTFRCIDASDMQHSTTGIAFRFATWKKKT